MTPAAAGLDGGPALFVSDLHLSGDQTASAERFFSFMKDVAPRACALYVLGDLFESWVGDDDLEDPFHARVAEALQEFHNRGGATFVMHGNRDFLLGDAFSKASGSRLLPDPSVIELDGTPTLLMHGDSLCTDDAQYQAFRARMRDPAWQQAVLTRSLMERREIARQLREQSETAKDGKGLTIMDVNNDAVVEALHRSGCQRLIHGHTHRPGRHSHLVDGQPCERWVLPDWYGSSGYLLCEAGDCTLTFFAGAPSV
jgi:UDP-2,3-diacylglucosamine hydrolase